MKAKTFYFKSYQHAIRHHLAHQLVARGWQPVTDAKAATFSDKDLCLNDSISILLEYKHLLAWLAQRFFPRLMPETYTLNDQTYPEVLKHLSQHPKANQPWILKPALLNNGDNIFLFESIQGVIEHYTKSNRLGGDHVVQRYLERPALLNGHKYTLRIPGILTNYAGVYLYKEGYINISGEPYTSKIEGVARKVHITNYVLDEQFAGIDQRLMSTLPNFAQLYPQLVAVVKTLVQSVVAVFPDYLKPSERKIFELFGFDFVLDADHRVWLLEVNQGPDFPVLEDHPLFETLWRPFWGQVVEQCVEPRLSEHFPEGLGNSFHQVLSAAQAQKSSFWLKRRAKRFLRDFGAFVELQE